MGLYSQEDVEKSKRDAEKFTEKIKDKQKKDMQNKAIFGWALFLIYAGGFGIGAWIVILIIKALSKYISG